MNDYWKNRKLLWNTFKLIFTLHPFLTVFEGLTYLFNALIAGIMPLAWKMLFDGIKGIISGGSLREIWLRIGVFFALQALEIALLLLGRMPDRVFGYRQKVTMSLKENLYGKASEIPFIEFENDDIYNAFMRAEKAVNSNTPMLLLNCMYQTPALLISILTMTVTMWTFSPWFVLAAALSVLPATMIYCKKGKTTYNYQYGQTAKLRMRDYFRSLFLHLNSAREMRVYNSSGFFKDNWLRLQKTICKELIALYNTHFKLDLLIESFRVIGYGLGTLLSVIFFSMGAISITSLGACLKSFESLQTTYDLFLNNLNSMQESYLFFNDYIAFMQAKEEPQKNHLAPDAFDSVAAEHLSFKYPNQTKNALHDISFSVKRGEKIAIVGENGSGKSTLCKILANLYSPTGKISWNGHSYNPCSVSALFQDYVKYCTTVKLNVALSDIKNRDKDAEIAKILSENGLEKLPLGLKLGKELDGTELSEGQWQRLALSRAEFSNSDVLIFDEPTAAIDAVAERELFEKLIANSDGKTLFLVTHRIGSARLADRIIVLDRGEIAETGTHEQLMNNGGKYYEMLNAQAKWYA